LAKPRRTTKDVSPKKPWQHLSLTGFYIEQELLRAKRERMEDDEGRLRRIANDARYMFYPPIKEFRSEESALYRVTKEKRRLVKGGWKSRPVRAVVSKLSP